MGVAVGSSADAERFSFASVDPTLRRLRAPLSGATRQGRPQGGFWRYAPGGRRGASTRFCGLLTAGGDAVRLLRGSSPTLGADVAVRPFGRGASRVRLLRGSSPTREGVGSVAEAGEGSCGEAARLVAVAHKDPCQNKIDGGEHP